MGYAVTVFNKESICVQYNKRRITEVIVRLRLGCHNKAEIFVLSEKIRWVDEPMQQRNAIPFGSVAES